MATIKRLKQEEIDAIMRIASEKIGKLVIEQTKTDQTISKKIKDYNKNVNEIIALNEQLNKLYSKQAKLRKELSESLKENICPSHMDKLITEDYILKCFDTCSLPVRKVKDILILESTDSSFNWKEFIDNLTI